MALSHGFTKDRSRLLLVFIFVVIAIAGTVVATKLQWLSAPADPNYNPATVTHEDMM